MEKYGSIKTVWQRDPSNKYKTLIEGAWATEEFLALKNMEWEFTEKIDGTNVRVTWQDGVLRFGGRTDRAQMPVTLLEQLQYLFNEDALLDIFDTDACLYGEGYGAGIQKGGKYGGVDFILFDVKINGVWLQRLDVEDIADKLNVQAVPVVGRGPLALAVQMTSDGFVSQVAESEMVAEGLVMRPEVELLNRFGGRIITKIKHKDFVHD